MENMQHKIVEDGTLGKLPIVFHTLEGTPLKKGLPEKIENPKFIKIDIYRTNRYKACGYYKRLSKIISN